MKYVLLFIVVLALIWAYFARRIERRTRSCLVQERQSWTEGQIKSVCPVNDEVYRDVFLKAWIEFASTLHVDPYKIRPDDELSLFYIDGAPMSDLDDVEALLKDAVKNKKDVICSKLNTVVDVVNVLANIYRGQ